jgi:hypothetical protein
MNPTPIESHCLLPEELASERLARLLAYWHRIAADGSVPARGNLDPTKIGFILARVMLVQVRREPLDFYFRLIGTETEDAGQRGYQGKMLSQVEPPAYREMVRADYEAVLATGLPACHRIAMWAGEVDHPAGYERVILPFADAAGAIAFLLVGADWPDGATPEIAESLARQRRPTRA